MYWRSIVKPGSKFRVRTLGAVPPSALLPPDELDRPMIERIAASLRTKPEEAEPALERWAGELNLESRLLPGRIDLTVLEVLETGVQATLERVAASPPAEGWPA